MEFLKELNCFQNRREAIRFFPLIENKNNYKGFI